MSTRSHVGSTKKALLAGWTAAVSIAIALETAGCQARVSPPLRVEPKLPRKLKRLTTEERLEYLRRARVWRPTNVAAMDLKRGPRGAGSFGFAERVTCRYVDQELSGDTPKFNCDLGGGDVVKVKYGRKNGEVYAEVAASRLFWALGFGADRVYPVDVTCLECPVEPWFYRTPQRVAERTYEPATIERRLEGKNILVKGFDGWSWPELDEVDERGGASRAERDALKLLAVLIQHSDTKPEQQELICLPDGLVEDRRGNEDCKKPFMYVQDLGVAFGEATPLNTNAVDLESWSSLPVWRDPQQCVGELKRSLTGNLEHPRISEAGRKFLADLLVRLSDRQIRDLFTAARMEERGRTLSSPTGEERPATVEDWVRVFKRKREEILRNRCPSASLTSERPAAFFAFGSFRSR